MNKRIEAITIIIGIAVVTLAILAGIVFEIKRKIR